MEYLSTEMAHLRENFKCNGYTTHDIRKSFKNSPGKIKQTTNIATAILLYAGSTTLRISRLLGKHQIKQFSQAKIGNLLKCVKDHMGLKTAE